MEVTKVSKEAIEKAEIALGLRKAEDTTVVDAAKQAELKKAQEDKDTLTKEYADTLQKAEDLKAKLEGKEVPAKEKEIVIVKAEVIAPLNETFEKAVAENFKNLATLVQSKDEKIETLSKAIEASNSRLEKAEEFNTLLGTKIGIMAKQPLDRKAITTKEFIEKGGEGKGAEGNGTEKKMSFANKADRQVVADILFNKAIEKGGDQLNEEFAKAVQYVELGQFPNEQTASKVQAFLKKEHNILLTK